jgi:5-methyltetrahydropteroyltriglutamate--homocysteine methyltransferase
MRSRLGRSRGAPRTNEGNDIIATRFRADHIGSFLRSPEVHQARSAYTDGKISRDDLRRVEDAAILDVLAIQRKSGIGVYSDGEQRRGSRASGFGEAVAGFVPGALDAVFTA